MRQRILIAEDHEDTRALLTLLLECAGYEVQAVEDGQAAYEAFLQQPPDLLLTDLSMPQMDGFALVKAIWQETRFAHIPIILLTAYGWGRLKRLHPLGVNLVLEKPVEAEELIQAVQAILPQSWPQAMQH